MSRRFQTIVSGGGSTPAFGSAGLTPIHSNISSSRPHVSTWGTSVIPGNNTYGSYTAILTALPSAGYGISLTFHDGSTGGACKDTLVTIGIDPAGGTSYTDTINHLLASDSYSLGLGLGITYYFPLLIPAGATVAAKASVNNVTVGTLRVNATIYGAPSSPSTQPYITFVETLGATVGSSNGTAVTPGTASEGAWTSLGTTAASTWWHQFGYGCSSTTFGQILYSADLGYGSGGSQAVIIQDMPIYTSAAENITYVCPPGQIILPAGTNIWARLQASGTADTGITMIAYCGG